MSVAEELAAIQPAREMALTIGVFDGVHPGHRYLIGMLKKKAAETGLLTGVITFGWHPRALLDPQTELPYLTTLEERVKLIKGIGVDHVIVLSFTKELAELGASDFVTLLSKHLKMRALVIGPDFALGKGREGNAKRLRALGEKMGFTLDVVTNPVKRGERVISSTLIRQALAEGNVEGVTDLLGRRFRLRGKVVHGDHRGGELLGYPTINLSVVSNQALPADGTYITLVHRGSKVQKGVTNIGIRPTFAPSARTIETHIIDFRGNLYDQTIGIEFVKRLRGEIRFDSLEKLKKQIENDVSATRALTIAEPAGAFSDD